MLEPAAVGGIPSVRWQHAAKDHAVPAVFHEAWRAPDGRTAVVLSNWTAAPQRVVARDGRLGARCSIHVAQGTRVATTERPVGEAVIELGLPPHSCALLEGAPGRAS
jgi:hypothetical protein